MIRRRTVCVEEKFIDFQGKCCCFLFGRSYCEIYFERCGNGSSDAVVIRRRKAFFRLFFHEFLNISGFFRKKAFYEVSKKIIQDAVIQLFWSFCDSIGCEGFEAKNIVVAKFFIPTQ